MRNFLRVFPSRAGTPPASADALGMIAQILAASAKHRYIPAGSHLSGLIIPALRNGRAEVYVDERGDPVGYFIWAELCPETELRIFTAGEIDLHRSEFSEEGNFWVLDFAAPFGHAPFVLSQGLKLAETNTGTFRYLRRTRTSFWVRELSLPMALRRLEERICIDSPRAVKGR